MINKSQLSLLSNIKGLVLESFSIPSQYLTEKRVAISDFENGFRVNEAFVLALTPKNKELIEGLHPNQNPYLAPEILNQLLEAQVDFTGQLSWNLGVLLWQVLTGEHPFAEPSYPSPEYGIAPEIALPRF
jgi:hypothetical protein